MGNYLAQPITTKETSHGEGNTHTWGCSCMQGWRASMEDAHICESELGFSDLALFGVFDGHGGSEVAKFCKEMVPSEVVRQLASLQVQGGSSGSAAPAPTKEENSNIFGQALTKMFNRMDSMLQEESDREFVSSSQPKDSEGGLRSRVDIAVSDSIRAQLSDGGANHVGCTAVCILISRNLVVCANAGDSRAILCRRGEVVELSHDHKPNNDIEQSRISAAGATVVAVPRGQHYVYRVNGKLNLSRSIGDLEYKQRHDLPPEKQAITSTPDVITAELKKGDEFLVLACDGVWDVKSNEDVCDFVGKRISNDVPIHIIAEELLDDCITKDPKTKKWAWS